MTSPIAAVRALPRSTCGECEYFDRYYGDCLRTGSPRFQTELDAQACDLFYPHTSDDQGND